MRTEKGIDIDIDRDGWGAMVRKKEIGIQRESL